MNKSLIILIYTLVWVLLIVLQSLTLESANPGTPSFWNTPSAYYSVWIVDAYIIALYYINYFLIAPFMIKRHLFRPYIVLSLALGGIGMLLPVVFHHAWQWTVPGTSEGQMPLYGEGFIASIAAIAVGLSVRGVREWVRLARRNTNLEIALKNKSIAYDRAEARLRSLEQPVSFHNPGTGAKAENAPSSTPVSPQTNE